MNNHKWNNFLKDVFVCSLGAYGGPEAHIGVFIDQLVTKKKHLTEEELIELVALCSILPGPTSTQTIVAVGHKVGGPMLGFLTMLVWALPVLVLMMEGSRCQTPPSSNRSLEAGFPGTVFQKEKNYNQQAPGLLVISSFFLVSVISTENDFRKLWHQICFCPRHQDGSCPRHQPTLNP
jgi:hypothetical protein